MDKIKLFINNNWMVLLVGVFFTLTCVYNEFGVWRTVEWNVFAKLNREIFVTILLFNYRHILNNTISMLFCYGGLSYVASLSIIRLICAFRSGSDYGKYVNYMKDDNLRLTFSIIIFVILLLIRYLNKK